MSKDRALKKRPNAKISNKESFREVYLENINDEEIEYIVYYFDDKAPNVLYEVIINYTSPKYRNTEAAKYLGPVNYKEKEWLFHSDDGFKINCWTYKNKLIIAGMIKGTEWEEE
ncbi:hypothetical protein [Leptobacterium sp. I13]|uniref:hypothetical protein n=1 Tax=Leptobacterium meishanense TaxID=3128904 RepID=UPI0030EE7CFE